MANYDITQPLTAWTGDTLSLITEMKRRAGVKTDTELAEILGLSQSTVSTWRRRNIVPDQVILKLEIALLEGKKNEAERQSAVIALAMRTAEYVYQQQLKRGSRAGRWATYSGIAVLFKNLLDAIESKLIELERETGRWAIDLAAELIDSEEFQRNVATSIEQRLKKGPQ